VSGGPILLATRSEGKLHELRPMFAAAGLPVIGLADAGIGESAGEAGVEAFDTFEANALAKARYFSEASGLDTVADDSGLEVDALGGAPGVRSKRGSARADLSGRALDDANNRKLVDAVRQVDARTARYVCAAACSGPSGEFVVRGETAGEIVLERIGTEGFGYDPYFLSAELGSTFGASSREAKEVVSHRGRAFRALIAMLVAIR
jgi:XTP/dITP diphosphohydrolase